MDILWVCSVLAALVVGAALGAILGGRLARSTERQRHIAQVASLRGERDLLASQLDREQAGSAEDRAIAAELAPLRHTLDRVAEHVNALERDRVQQFGALGAALKDVAAQTGSLGQETATLSGALNSSGVRGVWGEAQLRRVLQHAGMMARCDFDEQVSATTRHDASVRPDVVVHLPGDTSLVIDAKAPLDAFLKAQGAQVSPAERDQFLKEHATALRRHVDTLVSKAYWSAFDNSPELVVCFVPSDAVLASALQTQPELYDHAQARKIVLASPATLLAVLRATAFAWQQEALNTNAQDVLRLGSELHTRLGTMGKHVNAMGASLRKSVETYNQFVGTMESRVMVTSRKMADLGVVAEPVAAISPVDSAVRPLTHADLLATELDDATPRRQEIVAQEAVLRSPERKTG
ncbi:MAG: DNA recombination protein RmuC [Ornithinimicrobium sp.]